MHSRIRRKPHEAGSVYRYRFENLDHALIFQYGFIVKNNRKKIIFVFVIPCCILITGMICTLIREDLVLFPSPDFTPSPYTDKYDKFGGGNSRIERFEVFPDRLIMSYTLKEGARYPYTGINIGKNGQMFDLRGYSDIHIGIHSEKSERMRLFIVLYVDGLSNKTDFLTNLYLSKEIPLWQDKYEYSLRISDFYVPEWWHDMNNINENDERIKIKFENAIAVAIERDRSLPLDITDTVELRSLRFSKDNTRYFLFFGILLFLYYSVILIHALWRVFKNRMVLRMQVIIPYKNLEIENDRDPEKRKIIEYLAMHYKIPGLTVRKVSIACSIPVYKIPVILKETFRLSFTGYINSLRLNEAKRLLTETDMSITDIAMDIGYNNISHFNSIFKFIENVSPREFRRKNRV